MQHIEGFVPRPPVLRQRRGPPPFIEGFEIVAPCGTCGGRRPQAELPRGGEHPHHARQPPPRRHAGLLPLQELGVRLCRGAEDGRWGRRAVDCCIQPPPGGLRRPQGQGGVARSRAHLRLRLRLPPVGRARRVRLRRSAQSGGGGAARRSLLLGKCLHDPDTRGVQLVEVAIGQARRGISERAGVSRRRRRGRRRQQWSSRRPHPHPLLLATGRCGVRSSPLVVVAERRRRGRRQIVVHPAVVGKDSARGASPAAVAALWF
mmetsp:Transcript_30886/g.92567  ORF Transcript_30886/g.92567 Transcript_30886/m.92567 type:complete len:261 (+) Transcript_30886:3352-4134(+)